MEPPPNWAEGFAELGAQMLERTHRARGVESERRFVEYFNISPARFRWSEAKS